MHACAHTILSSPLQLTKYYSEDKKGQVFARDFSKSVPVEMTAVVRKKELRERVDVNFDGRVSMLEFLLYQVSGSGVDAPWRAHTAEHAVAWCMT